MTKQNFIHLAFAASIALSLYFTYQIDQLKAENTRLKQQQTTQNTNWDFKADYSLTSK